MRFNPFKRSGFKRGDRVRTVAREPNALPRKELGRLGTFDRMVNFAEGMTAEQVAGWKSKRCWVIWDSPMEVGGNRFMRKTIVSVHHLELYKAHPQLPRRMPMAKHLSALALWLKIRRVPGLQK